ncbi:MAG: hypothetical protein HN580_21820 [Deltaproteobacteria bacterium]|jgi:hypothetical protein|nr:hypothetical protein [Deltaproteobacteria bacterium]MBT4086943.1 hypothetical protein [Deltaproteobacteria bacterium]MBT4269523.1 hypothetical protein [Deltaproteobacteria bacterium]MBT4642634.1 hypothetical protein [Deltaproteobacteria bacterium]MBT6501297.1 hypothetical protein [Deltaproteobacteria bacterium]
MSGNIDRTLIQNLVREVISEVVRGTVPNQQQRGEPKQVASKPVEPKPPSYTGKPILDEVTITTDDELKRFVKYLLVLSKNEATWTAVEKGIWKFRLNTETQGAKDQVGTKAERITNHLEKGVVGENLINALSKDGINHLVLGKHVVLTPLGKEKARQVNIIIEKEKQ